MSRSGERRAPRRPPLHLQRRAHAMVSASVTFERHAVALPRRELLPTSATTRATGMSPSKLQPNAAMMLPRSTGMPSALYSSTMACCPASCCPAVRFWLRMGNFSDAQS